MAGIPEAVEAGRRFGIKIIPGIEISTLFGSRYHLYICCDCLIQINFNSDMKYITYLFVIFVRISELH